jgi:CO/xanthine dehydrogenase Mo-binding subunit
MNIHTKSISRRQLLKGSGALVVSFSLYGPLSRALAQSQESPEPRPYAVERVDLGTFIPGPGDYLDPKELDSWLAVMPDGSITMFTGKVDIGTGTRTALAQIAAEELDVPFDRVTMAMGDTAKTVDQGRTVGSNTILRAGPQLRQAALAARAELLKLASIHFGDPVEQLIVTDGVVSVSANPERKVSYGELIGGKRFNVQITVTGYQTAMVVAPEVKAKSYKDYKIVGTAVRRVDLPGKFTGEYIYTPDFQVPGMLHGRPVRPYTAVAKPSMIDERSIAHIRGVVKVVQEGSFVGVVAETEWAAIQAAKALKVTWSQPQTQMPANREAVDTYLTGTKPVRELTAVKRGDVDLAFSQASKTLHATYHWPFQNHGMMLPSCAVADIQGDKATIWTGAQGPFTTRDRISSMMNVAKKNVEVHYVESSGCYGRLTADDAAEDAVLMSRAVGKPVRVQWTRADEQVWAPKGPQQLQIVRAALDAQGKVTAWDYLDRSFPWTESQGTPQLAERQIGIEPTNAGNPNGAGGGGEIYDFENMRIESKTIPWMFAEPMPLRTASLRSPGEPPRVFATESFMDEIAAELRLDPVQFRLANLKNNKRVSEALRTVAEKSGWAERPSPVPAISERVLRGRGVAVNLRGGSIPAVVAEVEVDTSTGKISVTRITVAFDCGLIINPDGVRNQIEGNMMQGVSRTLFEEVKFDATGVNSLDWASYPVLRFQDVPDVQIQLINRPELPATGAAEGPIVVVPAAIANAVFDATGVRLREIPFTPERVLNALKVKPAVTRAS